MAANEVVVVGEIKGKVCRSLHNLWCIATFQFSQCMVRDFFFKMFIRCVAMTVFRPLSQRVTAFKTLEHRIKVDKNIRIKHQKKTSEHNIRIKYQNQELWE